MRWSVILVLVVAGSVAVPARAKDDPKDKKPAAQPAKPAAQPARAQPAPPPQAQRPAAPASRASTPPQPAGRPQMQGGGGAQQPVPRPQMGGSAQPPAGRPQMQGGGGSAQQPMARPQMQGGGAAQQPMARPQVQGGSAQPQAGGQQPAGRPQMQGGPTLPQPPAGAQQQQQHGGGAQPQAGAQQQHGGSGQHGGQQAVSRPPPPKQLSGSEARSALQQANASRAGMHGVNSRPLPSGEVMKHADGKMTVRASGGRDYTVRPNGTISSYSRGDTRAAFRPDGKVREVHTRTVDVVRGPRSERVVTYRRPDRSVVVATGPGSGFVQRPVTYGGREYVQRSYVVGGRSYTRVYTTYRYRNVEVVQYVPRYYYAPQFYGYAYRPWRRQVVYAWGYEQSPWYGYYGGYYATSPYYAGPTDWLADYYLAQTLQAAYQVQAASASARVAEANARAAEAGAQTAQANAQTAQANAQAAQANAQTAQANAQTAQASLQLAQAQQGAGSSEAESDTLAAAEATPITPELKQAIAEQVKAQLARESEAAKNPQRAAEVTGLATVLEPGHLFVVDSALNVETADQRSCHLSPGDALRLIQPPPEGAAAVDLSVASGRAGDCPGGTQVSLSIENVAEMHNGFRTHIDGGMQALQKNQGGSSGLPAAPPEATAPPRSTVELPAGDEDVAKSLADAQHQADGTEASVADSAFTPG